MFFNGHIYLIQNLINGKIYVGQTRMNVMKRFRSHRRNRHLIGKAIRKYGESSFILKIVASSFRQSELDDLERYWITLTHSQVPNGYNLQKGGHGYSISLRKNYRESNNPFFGKTHSESFKSFMSDFASRRTGSKNPFFGKSHTVKSLELIKQKRALQVTTEETRRKMSLTRKGVPKSEEHRRKIRLAVLKTLSLKRRVAA